MRTKEIAPNKKNRSITIMHDKHDHVNLVFTICQFFYFYFMNVQVTKHYLMLDSAYM